MSAFERSKKGEKFNMLDNKKRIIIVVLVLLIVVSAILVKQKTKKEIKENFNGDLEILEIEAELNSQIRNAFSKVEESYKAGVEAYNGYKRGDFYNETRLNANMESGELSFISEDEIDTENIYDTLGNKQENLPSTKVNDNDVEISNSSIIEDGNYYLLRCTSNSSYTYYYIVRITDEGSLEIEWYCYTENEVIDSDLNDDIENNLETNLYN
jgi:hypothetical protein